MISILLADDSDRRSLELETALRTGLVDGSFAFVRAGSFQEVVDHLSRGSFDMLVIDLQLPILIGQRPDPNGGKQVLEYVLSDRSRRMPAHVIGITAFKECFESSSGGFKAAGRLLLDAPVGATDWAISIASSARVLANNEEAAVPVEAGGVILCSQYEDEFEQLICAARDCYGVEPQRQRRTQWTRLTPESAPIEKTLFAGWAPEMGTTAMAALTTEALFDLAPKYVALTGIAAACSEVVAVGDVVVADMVWDAEAGKVVTAESGAAEIEFSPAPLRATPALMQVAREYARKTDALNSLKPSALGDLPRIHVGPIASVHRVIAHKPFSAMLRVQNRRILALEMEGYGLFRAATMTRSACAAIPLVVKAISDRADSAKGDSDRSRASYNSARFCIDLLRALGVAV